MNDDVMAHDGLAMGEDPHGDTGDGPPEEDETIGTDFTDPDEEDSL